MSSDALEMAICRICGADIARVRRTARGDWSEWIHSSAQVRDDEDHEPEPDYDIA